MDKAWQELVLKMADDQLIIGHRNSEWTGLGPMLEEDIAFSSMAQDKIGHSFALFRLLHDAGMPEPDRLAFFRDAREMRNCQLVELPIGTYDFSLVRHFFFDFAEWVRFDALQHSSHTPLRELAVKLKSEIKYHVFHAKTWIRKLGDGSDESRSRIQRSIDEAFPYALGIFEWGAHEEELIQSKIFLGEEACKARWLDLIGQVLSETPFALPDHATPVLGGRQGQHTEHLQPLLDEMSEVLRSDPEAEW